MINVVCYGEVLWDVFPEQKKIGGAPLNVAVRLRSMGNNVSVISCVGQDDDGEKIIKYLNDKHIGVSAIHSDSRYKTGNVTVRLDSSGAASYNIEYPAAWDKIKLDDEALRLVDKSDVLVYGSLASRDQVSKESLMALLEIAPFKVFDVNLRKPHYTSEVLVELMGKADFIKFNDEEIFEIAPMLGVVSQSLAQNIEGVARKTNTPYVCVTKGKHGAILYAEGKMYYNKGYSVVVADTVGAGDSFLGALINKLKTNCEPQQSIDYACAIGALVASNEGANPNISEADVVALVAG